MYEYTQLILKELCLKIQIHIDETYKEGEVSNFLDTGLSSCFMTWGTYTIDHKTKTRPELKSLRRRVPHKNVFFGY